MENLARCLVSRFKHLEHLMNNDNSIGSMWWAKFFHIFPNTCHFLKQSVCKLFFFLKNKVPMSFFFSLTWVFGPACAHLD